ncbi:MAG: SRPBCC family protein [Euryarchaeota archaeon]|nr:SRPBCC family protein [Euryarchaeota archaeon]
MTNNSRTTVAAEPGKREVVISQVFDAPRELVWKALTDPELMPQWGGPKEYTIAIDKMDVRPGGEWRYVQRGPDGSASAFHGVYKTVKPPERLVDTWEWEGMPGQAALETITLEEQNGATKVTTTEEFQTAEDRDRALQEIGEGAVESGERLAELLKKME